MRICFCNDFELQLLCWAWSMPVCAARPGVVLCRRGVCASVETISCFELKEMFGHDVFDCDIFDCQMFIL